MTFSTHLVLESLLAGTQHSLNNQLLIARSSSNPDTKEKAFDKITEILKTISFARACIKTDWTTDQTPTWENKELLENMGVVLSHYYKFVVKSNTIKIGVKPLESQSGTVSTKVKWNTDPLVVCAKIIEELKILPLNGTPENLWISLKIEPEQKSIVLGLGEKTLSQWQLGGVVLSKSPVIAA